MKAVLKEKSKNQYYKDKMENNNFKIDEFGRTCFKIKKVATFNSYNSNYKFNKKYDKLKNLELMTDLADKYPNQWVLGKPINVFFS